MHAARIDDLPRTPATHLRLYLYAAAIEAITHTAHQSGSMEEVLERFPFIARYVSELADRGLDGGTLEQAPAWWREAIEAWESCARERLPLRELCRAARLDYESLVLLVGFGLCDEDTRFEALFDAARRPTPRVVVEWFAHLEAGEVRARIGHLVERGLVRLRDPDTASLASSVEVPPAVWEALHGRCPAASIAPFALRAAADAKPLRELCLAQATRGEVDRIVNLVGERCLDYVVIRGPRHNGRRTLLAALAREMDKGILEVDASSPLSPADWRLVAPLAALLNAMPAIRADPAPGETLAIPAPALESDIVGIAAGPRGGLSGLEARRGVTLEVAVPDALTRRALWSLALPGVDASDAEAIARQFRMTAGNIVRAAALARPQAQIRGRAAVTAADVRRAAREIDHSALDALAVRLDAEGDWNTLVVDDETRSELAMLESRCMYREHLPQVVGPAGAVTLNEGVRALLRGPSGTGKTLAARILASVLSKDLYRIDLSAVVNKYIGETEKNLERALSAAEALDVILLLDEGDSLLGQRTAVRNSNDRYANLETNFLLQRMECYDGILLITSNLAEQIDRAFMRRIDVAIDFRPPEASERLRLLRLFLPAGHGIGAAFLDEVTHRCALSGAQIRNLVLHASLVALADGDGVQERHLEAAIVREYRKAGAMCPLRAGRRIVAAV